VLVLISIVLVAAAATAGDYVWYAYGVRHTMTAGILHGALLLTTVGGALGASSGRVLKGLPIGAIAGIGGALSYYVLVTVVDRRIYGTAIPAAWVIMWLLLAALDGRWLRAPAHRSWLEVTSRGLAAALTSGLAFYVVVGTLWARAPAGRNYALQFAAWAFAWAPGLVALMAGGRTRVRHQEVASTAPAPARTPSHPPTRVETDSSITVTDLMARIDAGDTLNILDVRSQGEFEDGHVPGARNIPFMEVPSRAGDIPGGPEEELILYCGHGPRAYVAARALRHHGRTRIVYMSGHWAAWEAKGLRVES
jgi:rhodanese-related sulfurtransferase